eukprot:jgi/Astpho2/3970/fgenesh1_pg.00063_%23_31_t
MWLRAKDVARALGTWRKAGHENPFMGITLEQLKANYAVWLRTNVGGSDRDEDGDEEEDIIALIDTVEDKHDLAREEYEDLKRKQVDEIDEFDASSFPDTLPEISE